MKLPKLTHETALSLPRPRIIACAALFYACALANSVCAAPTFYGPTPYLSFADSPFRNIALNHFYLETFESGSITVPGVTITNNQVGGSPLGVINPNTNADSVDADDGTIDGSGQRGHSYANSTNQGYGSFGMTVAFSRTALGGLPTYAGLVWTDGSQTAPTLFEAFDENGVSLGTIGPIKIGDSSFAGTTGEDRFFGVRNDSGISRFVIRDPGSTNNLEIDHLQFGFNDAAGAIPEPSGLILVATGLLLANWRRMARQSTRQCR